MKAEKPEALLREKITPKTEAKSELRVNISHELEEKLRRAREVFRTTSFEETLEKVLDLALKHKDPVEKAKRAKVSSTCKVQTQRKTRYIPAPIKHQVNLRDEGMCQEKGCGSKVFTEIHHIKPLSEGGKHELSNLTTLCSVHHNRKHKPYKPGSFDFYSASLL